MTPHPLQHSVATGLQRGVNVRRQTTGNATEEIDQAVIDLCRLERRQSESYTRHVRHQSFHELAEAGHMRKVLAVTTDVYTGEDELFVMLLQRAGFGDYLFDRTRATRPARDGRRTEGTVLVATVLNF